jgi:hypothetical protein
MTAFPGNPPLRRTDNGSLGMLLVDRITGDISPTNLPEFDVFY